LTGFERPSDVPQRISEKIPKSYIPRHLTQTYNTNGDYGNIDRSRDAEFGLPRKTREIERELREEERVAVKKKPIRDNGGVIAEEYYLGRKIDSQDLGVAI